MPRHPGHPRHPRHRPDVRMRGFRRRAAVEDVLQWVDQATEIADAARELPAAIGSIGLPPTPPMRLMRLTRRRARARAEIGHYWPDGFSRPMSSVTLTCPDSRAR